MRFTWSDILLVLAINTIRKADLYDVIYSSFRSLIFISGFLSLLVFFAENLAYLVKWSRLKQRQRRCVSAGQCVICWDENLTDLAPWQCGCRALVCYECEQGWLKQSVLCPICKK